MISSFQLTRLSQTYPGAPEAQRHREEGMGKGKGRVGEGREGFRLELAGSVNSVPPCFQSPRMRSWSVTLS